MRAAFVESIREGGSFWMNLSVTADAKASPIEGRLWRIGKLSLFARGSPR